MNRTIAVLITLVAIGCTRSEPAESERSPAPHPADVMADKPATAQVPAERSARAADDKPAAAVPRGASDNPTAAMTAAADDKPTAAMPEKGAGEKPMAAVPADNTDKNERDRDTAKLTPMDQAENETDRSISQHARESVVKADDLSVTGKNVKIITVDGVVTLRGPVESAREKKDIATLVKQVDGVKRVDNQLEVASK